MPKLELKSVRETALEWGIRYEDVRAAVRNGEIRTITPNRRAMVPAGAMDEFLRRRTKEPKPMKEEPINAISSKF
jgi:hypothetical protein